MAYSDLSTETIAQFLMRALKKRFIPILQISHAFDSEAAEADVVKVPVFSGIAPTVYSKVEGSAYQSDALAPTKVDVLIDQRAHVASNLSAGNLRYHARVPGAAEAIAEKLSDTLMLDFYNTFWANVTIANFGTDAFNGDPANFDYDDMVDAWKTATDTWGGNAMFVEVLGSQFWANVLKDSRIVANAGVPEVAREAMLSVKLPAIGKGTYTLGENIPTNSEKLAGALMTPDALAAGFAPAPSVAMAGEGNLDAYEVYQDAETGILVTYRRIVDGDTDVRKDIFELRFGTKILDATRLLPVRDTTL